MKSGGVVIGLDVGTSAVKALALNERGEVVARVGRSYTLSSGPDGSAVQDAGEVIGAALDALDAVAAVPGLPVLALVPSAAMHSLVLLDAAGTVLAPALTWADSRAAATLPDLRARLDPAGSYAHTGCPLQAPYHPARLWWLRGTQPELWNRTARFVSLTDLLLHRLTGQGLGGHGLNGHGLNRNWATSVGLASTTGLWNLHSGDWDTDILAALGIDAAQLPAVYDAGDEVGRVQTGRLKGVRVLAGSSDGGLANLGVDPLRQGQSVFTVGTSGAVRRLAAGPCLDAQSFNAQARTWSYRLDRATHVSGGAINNGGLLLDWVRQHWYSEAEASAGFRLLWNDAARVPAGADGLTLLPYLTGERSPHWRSDLSATVHGLRLHHDRAHIARAALEAVAFSLKAVWSLGQQERNSAPSSVYSTGGLAAQPGWNSLLASSLNVPVQVPNVADASAVGAALLGHSAHTAQALADGGTADPILQPIAAEVEALAEAQQRWQTLFVRLYG